MTATSKDSITVWLVEDNSTFRKTVARVINKAKGMTCPNMFASCEDAIAALGTEPAPNVIIIRIWSL